MCRQRHGYLSAGEYDGVEVGVELATYILRTEERAYLNNKLQHNESFQEADEEAAYNGDVHIANLGADVTEKDLQDQVGKQHRFWSGDRTNFRNDGISYCHTCRCRIIPHCDVFAEYSEGTADFQHASRIGSVEHNDREHHHEHSDDTQPLRYPGAEWEVEFYHQWTSLFS